MARIAIPYGWLAAAVLVVMLIAACAGARSATSVPLAPSAVLKIETRHPGNIFALGAVGLSMEARELGANHLTSAHRRLVRLMRLLGPSILRIGGNSVDLSWWTSSGEPPPPWATNTVTPSDLSALHGLLVATGWRALLGVDLGHFEPSRIADEARHAKAILGKDLVGIELGNEPNGFVAKTIDLRPPSYSVGEYLSEVNVYRKVLAEAVPAVGVYGPALTKNSQWLTQIGVSARMFVELTQHYYPINMCPVVPPARPQPTAGELLSPVVRERENEILEVLLNAGSVTGRPTRVGETNSVACGPHVDASPGFAGALWSLDWALRAGSRGVTGLNFHGDPDACADFPESPICASGDEEAANAGDVTAQPEYYGLLAASQLEGGRFLPTQLVVTGSQPEITAWATVTSDGVVRIALDDLAIGGLPQPVVIPSSGYKVTAEALAGPSVDADRGIVLGGAAVTGAGRWHPKPTHLSSTRQAVRVVVSPTSAVIVTLRPRDARRSHAHRR